MLTPSNSFESRFLRLSELNEAGNGNVEAYEAASNTTKTDVRDRLNAILLDRENFVLAVNNNNEIMFLHKFKNLGGTFVSPHNKIVYMQGMGSDSPAFKVNEDLITNGLEVEYPNNKKLMEVSTTEQLESLRAIKTNKLACTQILFPTPFELKALLLAESKEPLTLEIAILDAAKQQDDNRMSEVEIKDADKYMNHTTRSVA